MKQRKRRLVAVVPTLVIGIGVGAGCASTGAPRSERLESERLESERVEIGYGSQSRKEMTGSVTSLTSRDLAHQRVARVEELLEDRVPGLTVTRRPDGSMSIRIRGSRSFLGNSEPLVVIDGMPVNSYSVSHALAGLAPQSVHRIDVLKDAGSTSVYGSRGANGVILITTKRAGTQ